MKLLILAGGFHEKLPYEELRSLDLDIKKRNGRIVVGETENVEKLKRLGYSHLVLEYLGSFGLDEKLPFDPEKYIEGKFAARFKKLGFSGDFEEKKGKILGELNPSIETVDLKDPDTTFYFLMKDKTVYAGRLIHRIDPDGFKERESETRPYSRPVSIPPREARCWVNLSGIEKGESLLDPFCGTGGILMEAGLIGCKVYGSDSEADMVSGSRINLDYYGLGGEVKRCKVQELGKRWDRRFDAVVMDPPYGRSARVSGDEIERLYSEALDRIHEVLKDGRNCVFGAPKSIEPGRIVDEKKFLIKKRFEEKVHGDLIREVFVLEKI